MMTAHGTVDKAVEAMQKGAYSYILKPFDNERLILYVMKAISVYQVIKENRRLRNAVESQYQFGNIIGKSKPCAMSSKPSRRWRLPAPPF